MPFIIIEPYSILTNKRVHDNISSRGGSRMSGDLPMLYPVRLQEESSVSGRCGDASCSGYSIKDTI